VNVRRYDRQAIVEGKLEPLQRNPNAAWADPLLLHDGPRKVTSVRALHVNRSDGRRQVALTLRSFGQPDDDGYFTQRASIHLDDAAVRALCQYLGAQEALKAVCFGEHVILGDGRVLSQETAERIASLVSEGGLTPDALANMHAATQHAAYRAALAELEELLQANDQESAYQAWFEGQPWAFGTSYVGRVEARTVGLHEQVDIILKTADGYLDIIELKRPSTDPLRGVQRGKGLSCCWSAPAAEAIGQCAHYLRSVEEKRHLLQVDEGLPFVKPRARVVMGRSHAWETSKHDALRTLNAALHGVEVWTYDHVLTMARQLVACYEGETATPGPDAGKELDDPFAD